MNLVRKFWHKVSTTAHSRELEREVLRERAEAVRLRGECERLRAENAHESAEIARQRAENDRLRAENRALLNSILGIAGIPPVIVDPPVTREASEFAQESVATNSACDAAAGAIGETPARQGISSSHDRESSEEAATMDSNSLRTPDKPSPSADKPASPAPQSALFGPPHAAREPHGAAPVPSAAVNPQPPGRTRFRLPRNSPFAGKTQQAVGTRRRSWHQINRMLELQSARKPANSE